MTQVSAAELARLVRAVAILALPAEGQIAWLSSLGMGEPGFSDELALELENGVLLVDQYVRAGWLRPEARSALSELDSFLTAKSTPGSEGFWSLDSLRSDGEWGRVRAMAFEVLKAL